MATHMDRLKTWVDGFGGDVHTMRKLLESTASVDARTAAAAALSYLVSRMDLVPDWEETAGILDDAMVLRLLASIATDRGLGDKVPADLEASIGRLANEAEVIQDFLGADLYARFKKHVEGLQTKMVRGRTPRMVVDNERERKALLTEIEEELHRLPPAPMSNPDAVERMLKNNLKQKLA